MFLVSFSVTSVPIIHAISQKTQGKYTCTVQWVGHVLRNVIELHPSQNTSAVVLLKMSRLSLKPKSLRNFKNTWVCFKNEYGPNSGNAKSLWAFTKFSFASCWKKLTENKSALSIAKNKYYVSPESIMNREGSTKMFRCMTIMLSIWRFDPLWDYNVLLKKYTPWHATYSSALTHYLR